MIMQPWFQCRNEITTIDDEMIITSNGIPNHDFISTMGCCADEVNLEWHITLNPTNDTVGGTLQLIAQLLKEDGSVHQIGVR